MKALRPCGVVQRISTSKAVWSAVKPGWPRQGEVLEALVGDDQIAAHDGGRKGKVLLEWREEIEGERLAGEEVIPHRLWRSRATARKRVSLGSAPVIAA